jgi:HrpA-like RNA helicase
MPEPTLLIKGALKIPADAGDISPISYIVEWLKKHMPEFGGRGAAMADRVLIVQSETGSGKSTVLPVYVFRIMRSENTPRGRKYVGPSVLCTQPRVLTAIDLARRQVGSAPHYPDMKLGETVGFQTGPFSEKPPSGLLFATIGILAAQLRTMEDADIMARYRFIIIDEAHERSREADATLLRLKNFYTRNVGNEKLPFLILASATIELSKYAAFFGVGPGNTVHVVGRSYPITPHWPDQGTNNYPRDSALRAIEIHESEIEDPPDKADILIFVPGEAEIMGVKQVLEEKNLAYMKSDDGIAPFLVLAINREAILEESKEFQLVSEKVGSLQIGRAHV